MRHGFKTGNHPTPLLLLRHCERSAAIQGSWIAALRSQ
jgi:hypothetical protein